MYLLCTVTHEPERTLCVCMVEVMYVGTYVSTSKVYAVTYCYLYVRLCTQTQERYNVHLYKCVLA